MRCSLANPWIQPLIRPYSCGGGRARAGSWEWKQGDGGVEGKTSLLLSCHCTGRSWGCCDARLYCHPSCLCPSESEGDWPEQWHARSQGVWEPRDPCAILFGSTGAGSQGGRCHCWSGLGHPIHHTGPATGGVCCQVNTKRDIKYKYEIMPCFQAWIIQPAKLAVQSCEARYLWYDLWPMGCRWKLCASWDHLWSQANMTWHQFKGCFCLWKLCNLVPAWADVAPVGANSPWNFTNAAMWKVGNFTNISLWSCAQSWFFQRLKRFQDGSPCHRWRPDKRGEGHLILNRRRILKFIYFTSWIEIFSLSFWKCL